MDHVARFKALISEIKLGGRYRTFIELERIAGAFPTVANSPHGQRDWEHPVQKFCPCNRWPPTSDSARSF
jgi:hypothetical protein